MKDAAQWLEDLRGLNIAAYDSPGAVTGKGARMEAE